MVISSGIAIGLGVVFACLFLAFIAELYYLLWCKKKIVRINNNSSSTNSSSSNNSGSISNSNDIGSVERDVYNNYTKQLYYLFCLKQKPSSQNAKASATSDDDEQQQDIEIQKPKSSPFVGEESIESELMRLHNLSGPSRFLFTIDEETKEDLIEFDRKSTSEANVVTSKRSSRNKSLNDLLNESPLFTPVSSPLAKPVSDSFNNPLFETATEAELNKIRCSPPPKFKFLRDAEEKLLRKLFNESEKTSVKNEDSDFITLVVHRHQNHNHNHNQVLPLYSSPRSSYS